MENIQIDVTSKQFKKEVLKRLSSMENDIAIKGVFIGVSILIVASKIFGW